MDITPEQVRAHRLRAHHLDRRYPASRILEAAGACGLQNSPPGGWETALFQRLEGCSLPLLRDALYRDRALLQAWSIRGVPLVFPAGESGVFLSPLLAGRGSVPGSTPGGSPRPWTLSACPSTRPTPGCGRPPAAWTGPPSAARRPWTSCWLTGVGEQLPPGTAGPVGLPLHGTAALTGDRGRRRCLLSPPPLLLCLSGGVRPPGRRTSPTFTSFRRWLGREPSPCPQGEAELVRRFLHCYGPAAPADLQAWLGSSPQQAKRLWSAAAEEMEPVRVLGRTAGP